MLFFSRASPILIEYFLDEGVVKDKDEADNDANESLFRTLSRRDLGKLSNDQGVEVDRVDKTEELLDSSRDVGLERNDASLVTRKFNTL